MKYAPSTIVGLLLLAGQLWAAEPKTYDAQVRAATADAVDRLRADIEIQRDNSDLTIGDFLQRTSGWDPFLQALHRADQIGGPRWIDNETCQVKLAIGSAQVRQTLVKIAQDSGRASPLPPDALAAKLQVWDDRTFTATGTSISAARAQQVHPTDLAGPWRTVPEDARKQTIAAARDDASDRVLESIGSIDIADGKTVSQALADKDLRDAMRQWLAARPVTRLEFRSDLSVELRICAEGRDLFDAFSDAASKSDLLPKDPVKVAKIRQAFMQQTAPAIGSARVAGQPANVVATSRVPRQPPQWITRALNTEATQKFKGTRLKTARDAENAARDALRDKVDALQLLNTTIGEAAKHDPAIEKAVQQAMDRARAYKIDYLPDGSATVKVSLDPRDLWDQLCELP